MATFVILLFLLASVSSDPDVVQAQPGEDKVLRCQTDGDVSIRAVEWTRPDLKPDSVLFCSDGHTETHNEHFKNRVQLEDGSLKHGDLSLILRNISINDSGTFECRAAVGGLGRKKRAIVRTAPIRRIQLEVTDSGSNIENPTDGNHNHVGLAAGLVCFAVVGLVVGVVVRKYKRRTGNNAEPSAADEAVGVELI
ncbi:sodium channel regulatory subunit beta-3-like [Symphorus nematophorus]